MQAILRATVRATVRAIARASRVAGLPPPPLTQAAGAA
jgi:hypothetical protein